MIRQFMKPLASVAALATGFAAAPAMAQGNDGAATDLGEIVLVGTGLPTAVLNSPASVNVVSEAQLNRVPPSSVAEILAEVPGLRITESGIQRITIRGEGSRRVAIMIDGQKLADHSTYGTPILVDPSNIDSIGIVRGPSSVVSGNRAIGGVVNIITKRGADKPLEITARTGYFSANDGYRGSLSAAGTIGAFDYRLAYTKSDFGDIKTPTGTLVGSGREDQGLSLHAGYRSGNHYYGLKVQDYDLSAQVYTGDPNFFINLPKRDLMKYALFYEGTDLTPWLKSLKVSAFSEVVEREFVNNITMAIGPGRSMSVLSTSSDEQTTKGIQATAELKFSQNSRTVVGVEFEDDRLLSDKTTVTRMSFLPFPTTSLRYSDASIRTFSVFGKHEVTINDRLTATIGARFYKVDASLDSFLKDGVAQPTAANDDSRVLGSAGLVYKPSDDMTLRANISQGYTYPTLSQLFLETTAGGGGTTIGNPNLKPETSTTFELGARMSRAAVVLDATVFYTDARDYIASMATATPMVYQYQNVSKATSYGAELSAEFEPAGWNGFRPYVTAAYVKRKFYYAPGSAVASTTDTGTPRLSGTIGVRKDWTLGNGMKTSWDLFIRGESNARSVSSAGAVSSADAYTTLNLRGAVNLSENIVLSVEADNLLDKDYTPFGQYQGAGRNVSVFLTAKF